MKDSEVKDANKSVFIKIFDYFDKFKPLSIKKEKSAKELYLVSKYGYNVIVDDNDRYNKLIKSINDTIDYKVSINEYHCTRQIPKDLVKFKDNLIKHYLDLGFTCIMLNEKVKEITDSIIFISWANKFD